MATSMFISAKEVGQCKPNGIILVTGKADSGRETFIKKCTDKEDLERSGTSSLQTYQYYELPSILELEPVAARNILYEFARHMLNEYMLKEDSPVGGIVHMLRIIDGEDAVQASEPHFKFSQTWVGNSCVGTVSLVTDRPTPKHHTLERAWRQYMGESAIGPYVVSEKVPTEVVQDMVSQPRPTLQLLVEMWQEKKKLRKTTLGKYFTEQLKDQIKAAKEEKSKTKRNTPARTEAEEKIRKLETVLEQWKSQKRL